MALYGSTLEAKIWNFLKSRGYSDYATAGIMGNLSAESGFSSKNMQNSYEGKYNDDSYTTAIDSGTYGKFATDSIGYGLAQWTSSGRKQRLYDFTKSRNKSISDFETQLEFLDYEMSKFYSGVKDTINNAKDIATASNAVLTRYEIPADQSQSAKNYRTAEAQKYYNMFAGKTSNNVNNNIIKNKIQEYLQNNKNKNFVIQPHTKETKQHEKQKWDTVINPFSDDGEGTVEDSNATLWEQIKNYISNTLEGIKDFFTSVFGVVVFLVLFFGLIFIYFKDKE